MPVAQLNRLRFRVVAIEVPFAVAVAIAAGTGLFEEAKAATRTVQFTGLTSSKAASPAVRNETLSSECALLISNLGNNSQKIDEVTFFSFEGGKIVENACSTSTRCSSYLKTKSSTPTTSGGAAGCIGAELAQGSTCLIRIQQDTIPYESDYGYCTGKIQVSDKSASLPGSVIAAGSIALTQEIQVVAGALSAALYDSAPKLIAGDINNTSASSATVAGSSFNGAPTVPSEYCSYNMNFYCAEACMNTDRGTSPASGEWSKRACYEHCGCYQNDDNSHWVNNKDNFNPDLFSVVGGHVRATDVAGFSPVTEQYPGPWSSASNGTFIQKTNPYFSGGMVHELIIGPYQSICSGNAQYFSDGGAEFDHDDIPSGRLYSGGASGAGFGSGSSQFERLFCAHRHNQPDLTSRAGFTVPFAVNGGQPF